MGTEPLVGAIAAMWLVLTGLAGGVIRYLVGELDRCDAEWEKRYEERDAEWQARYARLEAKLDQSVATIAAQSESMRRTLDAQVELVASQRQIIAALQGHGSAS